MNSIILDRRDLSLEYATDCLIVRAPHEAPRTLPLSRLDRLICMHNVQLSTQVIGQLLKRGIDFIVINQRHVDHGFSLFADHLRDANRRRCQYLWNSDSQERLPWARALVAHKLKVAAQLPELAAHSEQRERLLDWRDAALNCEQEDRLRGIEGAAQQALFAIWRSMLSPSLGFERRQRRPPPDPVNSALSLSYAMIHNEAVRQLKVVGLDPLLGMYHRLVSNRQALACDLMEPLRPRAEAWVVGLFSTGVLDGRHFSLTREGCHLGKQGREIYYAAYDTVLGSWRRYLAGYARLLARSVDAWAAVQAILP